MRELPIFKQLLDLSHDCVKQLDLDGRILAINAPGVALLRLADEHSLIGQAWSPMWPVAYQPVVEQALAAARAGQRVQFVAASQLPDQPQRWWSVAVGPLTEVDGQVVALGAISREVTERVQLEASLDALNGSLRDRLTKTRRQLSEVEKREALLGQELDAAAQAVSTTDRFNAALQDRLDLAEIARGAAEQVALQTQKGDAVGQLVTGMGHDLNNRLQTVLSAIDALPSVGDLTPTQERFVGFARAAAQHAALMSRRLIAFSRQHPFLPEHVDLTAAVAEVVPLVEATLGRDMALVVEPSAIALPIFADIHSIQQGLLNVCLNAKEAFVGAGTIQVRFGEQIVSAAASRIDLDEGDYVFVEVEDNGRGMDEDVMEKLFEPFFTTKPEGKGAGLGLSQVLSAARQASGSVEVVSAPGEGTRVRLLLPRAPVLELA